MPEILEKLNKVVEKYAKNNLPVEDIDLMDSYAGNIDDAFWGGYSNGYDYGRNNLAKEILEAIKAGQLVVK